MTNGLPTSGKYRCEVAVSGTPGKLYVVYGDSNYGYGGVYRSTNGGNSWSLMSSTPNIMGWANNGSGSGGQAWYDLTIACDPNAENTIYVGGVNIWKSTNGGSTWSIVGHWYGAGSTPTCTLIITTRSSVQTHRSCMWVQSVECIYILSGVLLGQF